MNSTNMKQVAEVNIGGFHVELDETKLKNLADICIDAERNIDELTELNDRLLVLTDNFAGLDTEIFPFLRTLCEIKRDYRTLLNLGIQGKELDNGRE